MVFKVSVLFINLKGLLTASYLLLLNLIGLAISLEDAL